MLLAIIFMSISTNHVTVSSGLKALAARPNHTIRELGRDVRCNTFQRCFSSLRILRLPRLPTKESSAFGRAIENDYAQIRAKYRAENPSSILSSRLFPKSEIGTPENPIVLAHGLLGFDKLHLAGPLFPGLQYWRGITEALAANGIEVITASVPASASIKERAEKLSDEIMNKAHGKSVNIIA